MQGAEPNQAEEWSESTLTDQEGVTLTVRTFEVLKVAKSDSKMEGETGGWKSLFFKPCL